MRVSSRLIGDLKTSRGQQDLQWVLDEIVKAINTIEFGSNTGKIDNVFCNVKSITTPGVAHQEFSVAHTLNRIPRGYWWINQDQYSIIYDGTTPNTETTLYLRCDTTDVNGDIIII